MGLELVEAPDLEQDYPLSDEEIAQHIKRDSSADDDVYAVYKIAAFEAVQKFLRRPILTSTYELTKDEFPVDDRYKKQTLYNTTSYLGSGLRCGPIDIPMPPLVSVEEVTYVDGYGNLQTLNEAAYQVDSRSKPGRILPAPSTLWPETQIDRVNAVTVKFICGWDKEDVPSLIKSGILVHLANMYKNKESLGLSNYQAYQLSDFVEKILGPYQNRFTT